jgi:hypothetical protein
MRTGSSQWWRPALSAQLRPFGRKVRRRDKPSAKLCDRRSPGFDMVTGTKFRCLPSSRQAFGRNATLRVEREGRPGEGSMEPRRLKVGRAITPE